MFEAFRAARQRRAPIIIERMIDARERDDIDQNERDDRYKRAPVYIDWMIDARERDDIDQNERDDRYKRTAQRLGMGRVRGAKKTVEVPWWVPFNTE